MVHSSVSASGSLARFAVISRQVLAGACAALTTIAVGLLGYSSAVSAEVYEWSFADPQVGFPVPAQGANPLYYYSDTGGSIRRFDARFDSATNRLRFSMVLAPGQGSTTLPDSYKLVLNHGPMPWLVGEAAVIYFDARTPTAPRLSVYGYNAGHELADRSWEDGNGGQPGNQPADRICSSVRADLCGNFVYELSVADNNGERTFVFDIDATSIVGHTPLYTSGSMPPPWHGTGFRDTIGLWFHPATGRHFVYNADGYIVGLEKGASGAIGFFDMQYWQTNTFPSCEISVTGSALVRPNGQGTVIFRAHDIDDGADPPSLALLGATAPYSCVETFEDSPTHGSSVTDRVLTCTFTAPVVAADESYPITALVTDSAGRSTECSAKFVSQNTAPECSLALAQSSNNQQCEGAITTSDVVVSVLPDADGDLVIPSYEIQCSSGSSSIAPQSPSLLVATITGPGTGAQTSCVVTATVTDGFVTNSCALPFTVPGCTLDCAGTPLGTLTVDRCGVCGGNDACIDCAGTPFGTVTLDRCNICGGDGTSCLGCGEVSNQEKQLSLDSLAAQLDQLNRRALRELKRAGNASVSSVRFERRRRAQSFEAYLRAWRAVWSVASTVTQCSAVEFCQTVAVSGADQINTYDQAILKLDGILTEVANRLRQIGRVNAAKRLLKRRDFTRADIAAERAALVLAGSACLL